MTAAERRAQQILKASQEARTMMLRDLRERDSQIVEVYRKATTNIRRAIDNAINEEGAVNVRHLEGLMDDINRQLSEVAKRRNAEIDTGLQAAAEFGVDGAATGIASAADIAIGGSFHRVSREAVEFINNFVHGDGLQLSDRLWRLDRGAKQEVATILEDAIVQGSSARDTARAILRRGDPLSAELKAKMGLNTPAKIGNQIENLLTPTKGVGNPVYRARLVAQTEINRAHRTGYRMQVMETGLVTAMKWNLSKSHPRPDICDTLAEQDLHGLGAGIYPIEDYPHVPAHPGCICFETAVLDESALEAA